MGSATPTEMSMSQADDLVLGLRWKIEIVGSTSLYWHSCFLRLLLVAKRVCQCRYDSSAEDDPKDGRGFRV